MGVFAECWKCAYKNNLGNSVDGNRLENVICEQCGTLVIEMKDKTLVLKKPIVFDNQADYSGALQTYLAEQKVY